MEALLAGDAPTGSFCHGDAPTMADVLLVPQIFNAQPFNCRLDHVPTVMRIHQHCLRLPAFASSVAEMGVTPGLHVTFQIEKGTCWTDPVIEKVGE